MSYYVFSTLTNDQTYHDYEISESKDILPTVKSKIFIKGGHGVAGKHLITPRGVMTEISDEEFEILKNNTDFQLHVKNGFIQAEQRKRELKEVIGDMEQKDKSAPLTPNDFSKRVPTVPGSEEVEKPKPSMRAAA